MTDMTAAQAAQQNNRTSDGKYATRVQSESGADLVQSYSPRVAALAERTGADPRLIELAQLIEDDSTLPGNVVDNSRGSIFYREGYTDLRLLLDGNYLSVDDESRDSTEVSEFVALTDFTGSRPLNAEAMRDIVRGVRNERARRLSARSVYGDIAVPGGNPGAEPYGSLGVSARDDFGGSVHLHAPLYTDEYTHEKSVVIPFSLDDYPYVAYSDAQRGTVISRDDGTTLTRWESEGVLLRVDAVCGTDHVLAESLYAFEKTERALTGPDTETA